MSTTARNEKIDRVRKRLKGTKPRADMISRRRAWRDEWVESNVTIVTRAVERFAQNCEPPISADIIEELIAQSLYQLTITAENLSKKGPIDKPKNYARSIGVFTVIAWIRRDKRKELFSVSFDKIVDFDAISPCESYYISEGRDFPCPEDLTQRELAVIGAYIDCELQDDRRRGLRRQVLRILHRHGVIDHAPPREYTARTT